MKRAVAAMSLFIALLLCWTTSGGAAGPTRAPSSSAEATAYIELLDKLLDVIAKIRRMGKEAVADRALERRQKMFQLLVDINEIGGTQSKTMERYLAAPNREIYWAGLLSGASTAAGKIDYLRRYYRQDLVDLTNQAVARDILAAASNLHDTYRLLAQTPEPGTPAARLSAYQMKDDLRLLNSRLAYVAEVLEAVSKGKPIPARPAGLDEAVVPSAWPLGEMFAVHVLHSRQVSGGASDATVYYHYAREPNPGAFSCDFEFGRGITALADTYKIVAAPERFAPPKGAKIPIRIKLADTDLTPAYRDSVLHVLYGTGDDGGYCAFQIGIDVELLAQQRGSASRDTREKPTDLAALRPWLPGIWSSNMGVSDVKITVREDVIYFARDGKVPYGYLRWADGKADSDFYIDWLTNPGGPGQMYFKIDDRCTIRNSAGTRANPPNENAYHSKEVLTLKNCAAHRSAVPPPPLRANQRLEGCWGGNNGDKIRISTEGLTGIRVYYIRPRADERTWTIKDHGGSRFTWESPTPAENVDYDWVGTSGYLEFSTQDRRPGIIQKWGKSDCSKADHQ